MNRLEFFKEIKKNLIQTAKELVSPIIEDDIEKIDSLVDRISGFNWYPLENLDPHTMKKGEDQFIKNQPIYIYPDGNEMKAVSKLCPNCGNMLHVFSYENKMKCLQCENVFPLQFEEETDLHFFRLKKFRNKWYIALKDS